MRTASSTQLLIRRNPICCAGPSLISGRRRSSSYCTKNESTPAAPGVGAASPPAWRDRFVERGFHLVDERRYLDRFTRHGSAEKMLMQNLKGHHEEIRPELRMVSWWS